MGALCDAMVDDMDNRKRMLPYLDLGNGKVKKSEMIRKGKDFDIASKLDLDFKQVTSMKEFKENDAQDLNKIG